MNYRDPNMAMIELVAQHLGEALLRDLVFVGGAVAGLLITDAAQPEIRPTEDVDLIVQVLARADYYQLEQHLRARGFTQDMQADAPICRWQIAQIKVDIMPTLDEILGFSNRWYRAALDYAETKSLTNGMVIRHISAPLFIATKLEAFAGRGNADYLFSHDLGDILAVVDGRESLIDECAACDKEVKDYFHEKFTQLLSAPAFLEALPGHLPGDAASQERAPDLLAKLQRLAT